MPTESNDRLTIENKYCFAGSALIIAAAAAMVLLWYITGSGIVLVPGITAFGAELFFDRRKSHPTIYAAWILCCAAAALGIFAGYALRMHPVAGMFLILAAGFVLYLLSGSTLTSLLSLAVLPVYTGITSVWYLILSIVLGGVLCLCAVLLRRWMAGSSDSAPAVRENAPGESPAVSHTLDGHSATSHTFDEHSATSHTFSESSSFPHTFSKSSAISHSFGESSATPHAFGESSAIPHTQTSSANTLNSGYDSAYQAKAADTYFLYHLSREDFLYGLIQFGICVLLLTISKAVGFPYAAAPALLLLFVSLTDMRGRMLHTPVSCALVLMMGALAGAFARMILCIRLGLPVLLCVIIAYAFVCAVCHIFNLYLPAAAEAAGLAWLIPQEDLMISLVQMLVGCCLFTAAAFLFCHISAKLVKKR